ncbi:SUMF1/EgtB/PvdO family nonheme iron enzyme [Candidatus Latescibacterota bacterium]
MIYVGKEYPIVQNLKKSLRFFLLMMIFVFLHIGTRQYAAAENLYSTPQKDVHTTVVAEANPSESQTTVRLLTRDSDTADIIPCRVTIIDSLGQYWGLNGQIKSKRTFFHTPGDTLVTLPPGDYKADIARGLEYTPVSDRLFTVSETEKPESLTVEIPIKRWIHMKELGWYSCDNEVHAEESLDPRGIYTVQLGEDLNILNFTALGEGLRTWDYQFWREDPFPFSQPFYPMVIGEEWRSGAWQNHMVVMGHPRRLSTYGNGFFHRKDCPIKYSYPPAIAACDEVHAMGGIVMPCHPFQTYKPWTETMSNPTERYAAYELPVDMALGKVDGMSVYTFNQADTWNRFVWYKLLNCGFRLAPYAGTDVITFKAVDLPNRSWGAIPGRVRSYTYIPYQNDELNFRDWMGESVKGRSFVSSGAMVFFAVNGEIPGTELTLRSVDGDSTVSVSADARWMGGITSISVIVNGENVYTDYFGGSRKAVLNKKIRLTRSSWIAVKVDGLPVDVFNGCAHTAPVYVTLDNAPIHSQKDASYFVNWIDRHITLLDSTSHFDTAAHKESTFALYRKGQDVFRDMQRVPVASSSAVASGDESMVIQGMRMVPVPAGTFLMGSDYEDAPDNPSRGKGTHKGEQPVHSVTVSAFEMSTTEVTVAQFRAFVDATGYRTDAERMDGALIYDGRKWPRKQDASWKKPYQELREDLPVSCVSWDDAVEFCRWLSKKTGRNFRLPTEAEWEYACRAGSTTAYNTGSSEDDIARAAWYKPNGNSKLHPVAGKTPNAWGLYDMHGNLWEWCSDWLGVYTADSQADPKGPSSGKRRVFRGGSWYTNSSYCRSTYHYGYPPDSRDISIGFRVVCDP